MYDEMLSGLLQSRARAWGELQHFVTEARSRAGADGRFTSEDQMEFERRSSDLDDYDTRIKSVKDRVDGDKQADEYRAAAETLVRPTAAPADDPFVAQEQRLYQWFTASPDDIKNNRVANSIEIDLRGLQIVRENDRNLVRETRSLRPFGQLEQRTGLNVGTATAGGDLFNTSFRSVLYQHLIFNSAIRQTRATVLTTGGGEALLLPKTTAHPTSAGTITPEAVTINESDPAFDQGTLNAYKYANLVLVSSELEQDTQVDLLGYLAMAMGRALGNSSGVDFVTGSGTSKPDGVLHAAGTIAQVTGGTPASNGATFAELTQLYDKIIPSYQINGEWFMSQSAMTKIRALVNSQGTPIFLPSLYGSQPDTLFGKPIILDPNVPSPASNATSIAFGDFSSYFIRDVAGLRFERSVDFKFDTDQVAYRAILRTDGDLLDRTGAIGVYKGGTA